MCHCAVMQIWVNKVQIVWGFNLHFNNHFIWSNPIQHLSNRCWPLGSSVPPLSLSLRNLSQQVMCCSAPLTYKPPPHDSRVLVVIYCVWHFSPSLSFILLFPSAVQFRRCAKKTWKTNQTSQIIRYSALAHTQRQRTIGSFLIYISISSSDYHNGNTVMPSG